MNLKEAIYIFIFFIVIALIFFYKILWGLIPLPTDLIVGAYYPWANYKWGYTVGVPIKNSKLSDAVSLFYPPKALAADFIKKGELPLWNPYMFGGYPLFASVQFGLLFPTMIFYLIFKTTLAWTLQTISQPILASFFMYLLLRHFKLDKLSSIFGSIAYGFGGFTILWMQWNTQANTALFLPILILLEDKYLTSKQLKWGVLFSIFISLQILAGYLPVLPFTLVSLIMWLVFKARRKFSLTIILFILLGILLSSVFSLPVSEHILTSQRQVEVLVSGEPFISPINLITLIAPDFFGNDATRNFWGSGDHMDFTLYTGIVTLIFALIGAKQYFKKVEIRFAIFLFITTLIITIANPLSIFLYKLGIWGGPSITMNRANFMINFSLAILGAYGVSLIKNFYSNLSLKPSIWISSIFTGVSVGLFMSKYILTHSHAQLIDDISIWLSHINISLRNLILPIFLLITVSILIWLIKKIKGFRLITTSAFILILILDLFRFGLKFNTFSKPALAYPETPITKFLEKYPNDRFIAEPDALPANMWLPFKISSMAGYDGVYPLTTAKLLAVSESGDYKAAPMIRWGVLHNFNSRILDETNTSFLVAVTRDDKGLVSDNGQISYKLRLPKYKEVFKDKSVVVLENIQSLPRVYLTKQVIKASDQDTLKYMLDVNFPIKTTAITNDFEFNNPITETLNSNLSYQQVTNSHIMIKTNSNLDAYLVVLDSFYPGWKALIDGKESKIYRTNYNFRGVVLPKGHHIVEFIYAPKSLEFGAIITVISFGVVILLLFYPKIHHH